MTQVSAAYRLATGRLVAMAGPDPPRGPPALKRLFVMSPPGFFHPYGPQVTLTGPLAAYVAVDTCLQNALLEPFCGLSVPLLREDRRLL
jgi:hypothetical protein